MTHSIFIAGTDTGIGKTTITCQLLTRLKQLGISSVGLKPIASGCEQSPNGLVSEDALSLIRASAFQAPYDIVNPFRFEAAIAPHIAAVQANQPLGLEQLLTWYEQTDLCDIQLIEGCGGWLVPLNSQQSMADFVKAAELPVILVVGMRLGCLNHALLTVNVMRQQGVRLLGWVANCLEADMPVLEDNIQTLKQAIPAPMLARNNTANALYPLEFDVNSLFSCIPQCCL